MSTVVRVRRRLAGVVVMWLGVVCPVFAGAEPPREPSAELIEKGRELFTRVWVPNDARSHAGDGLGPVFNSQSCVGCHDKGGVGGAGPVERNIDIATVSSGVGASFGSFPGYNFSYAMSMDFGAGRFEYRFGNDPNPNANAAQARRAARQEPPIDRNAAAAIHPGFRDARSVVLHRYGVDPDYRLWRETVPGPHGTLVVRLSQRNPTHLFGTGLIDSIPSEAIEAAAKRRFPNSARVKGRVSRLPDGRVGRFGWKAQVATLDDFVRSAAANENGLEVPGFHQGADPRLPGLGASGLDLNPDDCAALTAFVRSLPAPVSLSSDEDAAAAVKAGESTFKAIGCANCHLPRLGDVEGIYSDLLLHDMSPRLADTGNYALFVAGPVGQQANAAPAVDEEMNGANAAEWRTPPLWGLRDSAPYMHDGRATTIPQAIALHAGQGASAAQHYADLPTRKRQQLDAFLNSLTAPGQPARDGVARAR